MSSRSSKSRSRKELSKADLKAYESRRAAERRRIGTAPTPDATTPRPAQAPHEHSFAMTRDEEFVVIKSDLVRLLMILAVIFVALIMLTILLR